jgi:hypothetical protein
MTTKKKRKPAVKSKRKPRSLSVATGSAPFIPFVNNKGKVMYIQGSLTLGDLTRIGARVLLVPHGAPLADGEFKDVSTPDFVLPNRPSARKTQSSC